MMKNIHLCQKNKCQFFFSVSSSRAERTNLSMFEKSDKNVYFAQDWMKIIIIKIL